MTRRPTPGPWRQEFTDDEEWTIYVPAERGIYRIVERVGGQVHLGRPDPYGEVDANAHLIAAAPDLLDAVERMTRAVADLDVYEGTKNEKKVVQEWQDAFAAGRDAIAKANGKEAA